MQDKLIEQLGSYLAERGKNLATKEDVADITRKVEEVRAVFAKDEAEREQRYRLQLAALDKRLAVHQEAYTRWHRLWNAVHTDEITDVVIENRTWFHENGSPHNRPCFDGTASSSSPGSPPWLLLASSRRRRRRSRRRSPPRTRSS